MRNLLWIVAITALSACQQVPVQPVDCPMLVEVKVDDTARWLDEWYRDITLPEDQLLQTFKARELEFERSANPGSRLRLVLLLAEGPQPVRDQARALELLAGLDAGQASDSERALAALLKQVIEEQKWLSDKVAETNRKWKDIQVHAEELERQLQELTTIEQNIQQRELPSSKE